MELLDDCLLLNQEDIYVYLVAIVCLILAIAGAIEWYRPRLRRALVVSVVESIEGKLWL